MIGADAAADGEAGDDQAQAVEAIGVAERQRGDDGDRPCRSCRRGCPARLVAGRDRPRSARMKSTPETR